MATGADNATTTSVIYGRWPAGTPAGTYFVAWSKSGALEVLGKFVVPTGVAGSFALRASLLSGERAQGPITPGPNTIGVYNGIWNKDDESWTPGVFNSALTEALNYTHGLSPRQVNLSGAA